MKLKREAMNSCIVGVHHVAMVVEDLKQRVAFFVGSLGYKMETEVIHEINQKVFVQFLTLDGYRVELIQPDGVDSPVYQFLQKKGGLYHFCYETNDMDASVAFFRAEYGAVLTSAPEDACAMLHGKIAFLGKPDGEVIELVQFSEQE